MCRQSHFALLSTHERQVLREKVCKRKKKERDDKKDRERSGGRQRWVSEEESTF